MRVPRRPARLLAAALALQTLLGAAAPPVHAGEEGLASPLATRVHRALTRAVGRMVRRASASERVDLAVTASRLDEHDRMLVRVEGTLRVRVPEEGLRRRVLGAIQKREGRAWTANGPISYDLVVAPVHVEREEALLEVDATLVIATDVLLQSVIRGAASAVAGLGLAGLAESAAQALEAFDGDLAGRALSLAVQELPAVLAGEAGALAYAAFQDPDHKSIREQLRELGTPRGLLRHFVMAVVFLGASKLVRVGVSSLGMAAGTVLLPAGSPFVAGLLATGVWMFLGHRAVKAVVVKLPLYLRMARVRRLWERALEEEDPEDRRHLLAKLEGVLAKVTERFHREMEASYKRWDFLQLLTGYMAKRVRDRAREGEEPLDLRPYRPLLEAVDARLKAEAMAPEGWYAARFYLQWLDAIGALTPARRAFLEEKARGGRPGV